MAALYGALYAALRDRAGDDHLLAAGLRMSGVR